MGYVTFFNNFLFIEGGAPNVQIRGEVSSDLSFKWGAQMKNLNDVKMDMITKATPLGANCVVNFTYGQKSRWLAIDDVAYWGKGTAGVLSQADYEAMVNHIRQRDGW